MLRLLSLIYVLYFLALWVDSNLSQQICNSYTTDLKRGHNEMSQATEPNVITKTIVLNQDEPDEARQNIKQYFIDTFDLDTSLFHLIKPEYLWTRADPLRHPVCWYAAHSAAFYINKLRVAGAINEPHNGDFESRFAVGVDEMSWDDKLEDRDDWPPVDLIFKYRSEIREIVSNIIDTSTLSLPIKWNSIFYTILMGIEHERIHIETSSVLLRQLPISVFFNNISTVWDNTCKVGIFGELDSSVHAPNNELLPVKGKYVSYGRKINDFAHNVSVFGWDNEFGEMNIDVPDFNASRYLVSNEEYYEFILDGGYLNSKYWSTEGWQWVQSTQTTSPKFWLKKDGKWYLRNMLTEIELAWNWPVVTNHLEGLAFTAWKSRKLNKSIRLLTEDEWHVLRELGEYGDIDVMDWNMAPGNINLEYFASECPVDMFEFGTTGFFDVVGNVWQHTLTPQHPFLGFEVHAFYDDFTVPCFGPHHNIIKGGSWISTGNSAMRLSRYQFRRHFFQHAGIRYVESDRDISYLDAFADTDHNPYDDGNMVNILSHFHFWDEAYFGVENYPKKIAEIAIKYSNKSMRRKAMDVGCGPGRTAFELTKQFDYVVGLDLTSRLIGVGYRMQENKFLEWNLKQEGDIKKHYKVTADKLGLTDSLMKKVYFIQNDAQNMDQKLNDFDVVIASNIIHHLSNPLTFLNMIHERTNIGATFVLCDAYSWNEKYTAKLNWIGGVYDNENQAIYTQDALKMLLLSVNVNNKRINWKLNEEIDVEFVMKETDRVYKHILTHCMILQRI